MELRRDFDTGLVWENWGKEPVKRGGKKGDPEDGHFDGTHPQQKKEKPKECCHGRFFQNRGGTKSKGR